MNQATPPPDDADAPADRIRRLEGRLTRERRARHEAERLIEGKSRELYEANLALSALAADLERRVAERTHELSVERELAVNRAEIDALTGIANRPSFERQLAARLTDSSLAGGVAALLIDLDDFKTVNDTLGHAAGDAMLIEIAHRLTRGICPGDIVARLGGDEFAVITSAPGGREGALVMAHRLLRQLSQPIDLEGRSSPCGCSIGIAASGAHTTNPDELLRDADLALYAAKRAGRGRVAAFEAAMRHDVERRAALDKEVRGAIMDGCIEPWYQPIHSTRTGRYVGAEALARWRTAEGEIRGPGYFLGSVESLGLLDQMMDHMLRMAFAEARPLLIAGSLDYLSINISPSQFNNGWLVTRLPALLAEACFPLDGLIVEITETAVLLDADRTRNILAALTSSGIRIALDDFGVGYSNFAMLRWLPLAWVKLDRTLVCDIETDEHARALAEGILSLAASLNIKVVAEGVETQRQAELLQAAGCAALQGFWFSPPRRRMESWLSEARNKLPATQRADLTRDSSVFDSATMRALDFYGNR